MKLDGPAVANIPVVMEGVAKKDSWVYDDGVPGLTVVEGPVSRAVEPGSDVGAVMVAVDPGVEVLVSESNCPWKVGIAGPEEKKLEERAIAAGVEQARLAAATSKEKCLVFDGEGDEKVLSLKIADTCPHDAKNWEP